MNLKSGTRNLIIITGAIWGLSASPVQAGVVGSMTLDITNSCFSYGATGAAGCGNTDTSKLEYAKGSFTFNNTLSGISNPETYAYQATVTLHAEATDDASITFDDARSRSFASLAALQADPLWPLANSFVTTVMANPTGSFSAAIPATPPMGPFTVSWDYTTDTGSTPVNATGLFEAWSGDNLNGVSQFLFGRDLPAIPVNFSLNVTLAALSVPEPAMIALIGLGILGIGITRRRKIHSYSAAV